MEVMGVLVPFIYALLPNKKTETYVKLLTIIKLKFPKIRNESLIVDFEAAVVSAMKKIYPRTEIRYCLFHYSQAIYRNLRDDGLDVLYKGNMTFRFDIKTLLSIIFIDTSYVYNIYVTMRNSMYSKYLKYKNNLKEFFNYFESNWINRIITGLYFRNLDLHWRLTNKDPFTNNHAEGYNNALNNEISQANPNLVLFLKNLRILDFNNETKIFKLEVDDVFAYKYLDSDSFKKIAELILITNYDNAITNLKNITNLYHFKDPY